MVATPCVTTQIQDQSSSHAQVKYEASSSILKELHFSSSTLPRKLRVLSVTIDDDATQTFTPDKSGKANEKGEKKKKQSKEWMEASEYLTMDYRHVTRRRPIHNKSLPVAP
ncbi:hypothetical protein M5689_017015 [Euphorbia peplus]|nr:hypothetical protein M5689_017015 [Euphorbia peplus]